MLGFSMYLNRELTAQDYNYLLAMHNAGFTTIFTSLHIPEDDSSKVLGRLKELTKWCSNLGNDVIADVSEDGLSTLGIAITDMDQVKSLNLAGLRIDDGVKAATIAKLSKQMPIALNASTISSDDLALLHEYGADFKQLMAWHNYYPRPETGLDKDWLVSKNRWLHQSRLETVAFVAGDSAKRGPIHAGLPTLEQQRDENPLAAMLELQEWGCDHVFIGDAALSSEVIASFKTYHKEAALTLHVNPDLPALCDHVWHNRPDLARDVVRLTEGRRRQLFDIEPQSAQARPRGTITCDNTRYLRYQGEVQITRRDLPSDERVNVLGHVASADLVLLDQIDAGTKLLFRPAIK